MNSIQQSIFTIFLIILFPALNFAQSDNYTKVKLTLSSEEEIAHLHALDIGMDHFKMSEANIIEFVINSENLKKLDRADLTYEILIQDYRSHYKQRVIKEAANNAKVVKDTFMADHFGYGSMGGFYTLSEIEDKLDEMSADFPDLATPKYSIGTSVEGREIWAVKISDNPMVNEEEEAVYFDALHHAREPLSMAVTLNYAFWLLENYETKDRVKYLLDNREIYIVPCVNPDGYEYNRETNPEGGGLWRKNRRVVNDDCVGIDLNRNYSFGYAHDNYCASTDACSQTYRGAEAFSEPESVAIRDFLKEIKPNTAFSIHSTAGSCLMPYGYDTNPPAFPIYSEWASDFLSENDYPYGVTYQMLGYTSCGTTRSYLHSEGVYSWTLEIDGSGFWPQESEIFPLVSENVYPLFYQSWIGGQYTDVQSHEVIGEAVLGGSFELKVEVKNKGLGSAPSNVEVTILQHSGDVLISGDGFIGKVAARERAFSENFSIYVNPDYYFEEIRLTILVTQDGIWMNDETIIIPFGQQTVLFEDNAENGLDNWTSSGNGTDWGLIADDSYNGSFSFGDSDNGNSETNTDNYFTLNEGVDLTNTDQPRLEFYTKWSFDNFQDNVKLQISYSGEPLWKTLKTYTKSESWHQELIDLSEYKVEDVKIRFALQTDQTLSGDGFYVDKISIIDYGCIDCLETNIEETNGLSLVYYPNPATDYINVALNGSNKTQIKIFDTKGKVVKEFSKAETSQTLKLNLLDLKPNIYFIQILDLNSGTTATAKLVKT